MVTIKDNVMTINLKREVDDSYDVIAGDNAVKQLREDVESKKYGSKLAVIVSPDFHSSFDVEELKGPDVIIYKDIFANTPRQALAVMGDMSRNGFGRDSAVLSVGNNNIAGFIAAYFNRGINLITLENGGYVDTRFHISSTGSGAPKLEARKVPRRVYDLLGSRNKHVELKKSVDDSYDIVFLYNIFEYLAGGLADGTIPGSRFSRYAIVTDSNVKECQAGKLEEEMKRKDLEYKIFSFEAGEPNKTFATCERILEEMQQAGYLGFPMIALGGGVTGDMAGFAAEMINAIILQLPTSSLAQADSAVGGKTAVDTPYGKNLMGAFRQPGWVGNGSATLETLPEREYLCGFTEATKHMVIDDNIFLCSTARNVDRILKRNARLLDEIAAFNCRVKGNIVEQDPHEKGPRRQLNYGHTLGHAIEKLSIDRFQKGLADDYLLHGEAVAIGMALAGDIATHYGYPDEHRQIVNKVLQNLKQPIKIPAFMRNEDIMKITTTDKKAKNGKARFALPIRNGKMNPFEGAYVTYVENDVILAALKRHR
ncbi:3-dehydroquinate synthase [Candidatus Woesearchaeota archaeon]|nr:3-dehydroquinate synthase [Candidatus Woesearchaeota archaeon]